MVKDLAGMDVDRLRDTDTPHQHADVLQRDCQQRRDGEAAVRHLGSPQRGDGEGIPGGGAEPPDMLGEDAEEDTTHPGGGGKHRTGQGCRLGPVPRVGQDRYGTGGYGRPLPDGREIPGQLLRLLPFGESEIQLHRRHTENRAARLGRSAGRQRVQADSRARVC